MSEKFRYGVDVFNQVLAWRVEGPVTLAEVQAMALSIQKATASLGKSRVKVLVDHRAATTSRRDLARDEVEVVEEWARLLVWLIPRCSHVAMLCSSSAMKQQMDDATGNSGGVFRAFYHPDASTALRQGYAFVGVETNEVVAA